MGEGEKCPPPSSRKPTPAPKSPAAAIVPTRPGPPLNPYETGKKVLTPNANKGSPPPLVTSNNGNGPPPPHADAKRRSVNSSMVGKAPPKPPVFKKPEAKKLPALKPSVPSPAPAAASPPALPKRKRKPAFLADIKKGKTLKKPKQQAKKTSGHDRPARSESQKVPAPLAPFVNAAKFGASIDGVKNKMKLSKQINMSEELFKWVWAKGKKLSLPALPADWLRVREAGEGAAPKRNLADMIKGGVKLKKRVHKKNPAREETCPMAAAIKKYGKMVNGDSSESSDVPHPNDWDESSDDGRRRLGWKPSHDIRRDSPVMIRLLKEIIAAQD